MLAPTTARCAPLWQAAFDLHSEVRGVQWGHRLQSADQRPDPLAGPCAPSGASNSDPGDRPMSSDSEWRLEEFLPLLLRAAGDASAEWALWQSRPHVALDSGLDPGLDTAGATGSTGSET